MLRLVDLDIRISQTDFGKLVQDLESEVDNVFSNTNGNEASVKIHSSHSRQGRSIKGIEINDLDTTSYIRILGEESSSGDITFRDLNIKNLIDGCIDLNLKNDGDAYALEQSLQVAIKELAIRSGGTAAFITDDERILVREGKDISHRIKGLCMVDDKNRTYSFDEGSSYSDENSSDSSEPYVPTYLLNDWLSDNPEFNKKLSSVPKSEVMDYMGKFIVYQKKHNMVNAGQVKDILSQISNALEMQGKKFQDESLNAICEILF